jgi:hypothetical protein
LIQIRKENENSKNILREKESALQIALTQLGVSHEENKRLIHRNQVLECNSKHIKLSNKMNASPSTYSQSLIMNETGIYVYMCMYISICICSMTVLGCSTKCIKLSNKMKSYPSTYSQSLIMNETGWFMYLFVHLYT